MTQNYPLDSTAPAVDTTVVDQQHERTADLPAGDHEESGYGCINRANSSGIAEPQARVGNAAPDNLDELSNERTHSENNDGLEVKENDLEQPKEDDNEVGEQEHQNQDENQHTASANELPPPPSEDSAADAAVDRSCSKDTKTSVEEEPKRIFKRKYVQQQLEEANDDIGLGDTGLQQETKDVLGNDVAEVFVTEGGHQRRSVAPLNYRGKAFYGKEITSFGNADASANGGYRPNVAKPLNQKSALNGGKKSFLGNIRKINGKLSKIHDEKE